MNTSASTPIRVAAVALLVALAACGDDPVAPPGLEPQIVNNTDAFSYQITSLSTVTGAYEYTWQNTGTFAKVTHASNAGGTGVAIVTLLDADGTEVYSGDMTSSGETVSSPEGVAGAWTVRVFYQSYTNAQVNFAVVKQ